MRDRIPVTVVSGNLGAGKTTLLNRLLETADRRLAVLVNDVGDVNVDAALLEGTDLAGEGIAELSNGCICCELRDDLETEVRSLARRYDFDHLVVEASGISEPAPVARLFTSGSAAARYDVDALVTVVDASLLASVVDGDSLERETPPDAADRPLSDLLVEQLEVSDVVLLNKCDLVGEDDLNRLETIVGALQPDAELIRTAYADVPADRLLGRELFDPDALGDLAGWRRALEESRAHEAGREHGSGADESDGQDHEHAHRTPESVYGVENAVYRRQRPVDPERFAAVLRDLPESVVRLKGPCWLAGRDDLLVQLSGTGRAVAAEGAGRWIATLPPSQRDLYRESHPEVPWDERHGDRRTELVIIGPDLPAASLAESLDDCLVDPGTEPSGDDPFPTAEGERTVLRRA